MTRRPVSICLATLTPQSDRVSAPGLLLTESASDRRIVNDHLRRRNLRGNYWCICPDCLDLALPGGQNRLNIGDAAQQLVLQLGVGHSLHGFA